MHVELKKTSVTWRCFPDQDRTTAQRMSSSSSTTAETRSLVEYTPLPLSQISILFLLRFCEGASFSAIFPFLNEVHDVFKTFFSDRSLTPKNILAPYFCNRWRWEESWILRWLDGPSVGSGPVSVRDCDFIFQDTILQLVSLITVMLWSRMSDRIGRKPILLVGILALTISNLSFGLSRTFWAVVIR